MSSELPGRLCELVPPSRAILARAVVNAYRDVPWIIDLTKTGAGGQREFNYSAADAEVGSRIIGEFMPHSLVYASLAGLLRDEVRDLGASRTLLEHCGNFMAVIMAEDIGLKEALSIFVAEDIDLDVANRLARFTPLGQFQEFLDDAGIDAAQVPAMDISNSRMMIGAPRVLRYSDLWDAPACFLDEVPEVTDRFSHVFADAVRRAAKGPGSSSGSIDIIDAVVGRPIREMATPGRLVREVVAKVIDEMFQEGEVSNDLISRCCEFIALAIDADKKVGGHLIQVLQGKFSKRFARIAIDAYHAESELMDILKKIADRSLYVN